LMEKREFLLRNYDHVGRTAVYDEVEPPFATAGGSGD
jgi:hypothetical protein